MSISTIIIGKNKESKEARILNIISDSKFQLKNNPDLLIIEKIKTKKSIGIEEVREIGKFLKILPISHTQKIVIIKEAEILTPEAQNSLLKILEEPPQYARIILEAETDKRFLATIISRCQVINASIEEENIIKSSKFIDLTLNDKFNWAETTSKLEKDEVIEELNSILKSIKESKSKVSSESINILLDTIENISKYNLNIRLALEYLSLNFEKKDNKL